jgi:hypothetical protein
MGSFEPMAWIRGAQGEIGDRTKQQEIQDGYVRELAASTVGDAARDEDSRLLRNLRHSKSDAPERGLIAGDGAGSFD